MERGESREGSSRFRAGSFEGEGIDGVILEPDEVRSRDEEGGWGVDGTGVTWGGDDLGSGRVESKGFQSVAGEGVDGSDEGEVV